MHSIAKWRAGWRTSLAQCARDDRGIAAVEFAMIAPLMIVMIFGMIDVSMGVGVDRKVTMVAQSMSDLASRATSVDSTEFANFTAIGVAMLSPYPTADLSVVISQIYIDPKNNGAGKVYWSNNTAVRAVNSSYPVPAGLIGKDSAGTVLPDQYLILAEVKYIYKPIIGYVVAKAGITLSEVSYTRPRQSSCVAYLATPLACN